MTPLHAFILADLAEYGPMRDVEIWQHTTELTIDNVTRACAALEGLGYVEKSSGVRPVTFTWQLTKKGRQYYEAVQE